jgi:creatinine amidohydrolase/Fe(II)-dependent formamide hydrolase-like protein
MLAIDPRMVRMGRLQRRAGAEDGGDGDPSRASAELGRLGVDLIVTRAVDAIKKSIASR